MAAPFTRFGTSPVILEIHDFILFLNFCNTAISMKRVKGKAIPLQAWADPEGSRKLGLPDFKTIDT